MNRFRPFFAQIARWTGVGLHDEAKAGATPHDAELRANFAAIVINGFFFPTAGKILGAGLLLTWFVGELTDSAFFAGLLIPIQYGIALLAQPWIGQWLSSRAPLNRYYRNQALLRGALWAGLGVIVTSVGNGPRGFLLGIFFAVVLADAIAAGVGTIAFGETLARVMPKSLRGRARGGRGMAGALMAGAAGILIHQSVSPGSGLPVFAGLFLVAGACYALGGLVFAVIAEPQAREPSQKPATEETFAARLRAVFETRSYPLFFSVQALLVPATQGLAFLGILGRREFHLDVKALGLLLVSDAAAPFVGNWLWGKGADRQGNRRVLLGASAVGILAPACAMMMIAWGRTLSAAAVVAAFGVMVFATGLAGAGVDLASKNFILDLAPGRERRPMFIGVNDTLVAIPTLFLASGGAAIDRFGFQPVFAITFACSAGATLLAFRLQLRAGPERFAP